MTSEVVTVDINPACLERLAERFRAPRFALEVQCADVAECSFERESFDLVHAALVLEYVDWPRLLPRLAHALRPGGVLRAVLPKHHNRRQQSSVVALE